MSIPHLRACQLPSSTLQCHVGSVLRQIVLADMVGDSDELMGD